MADWSGNDTQQSSVSSAPSNPAVNNTITSLAQGVQKAYDTGPAVFDQPLYAGTGPTTQNAQSMSLTAAANPDYAAGVNGAIKDYSKVAAGDYLDGNDPTFQRDLGRTLNDTAADVNSFFGASGRLGSTGHVDDLTTSLAGVRDKAYLTERQNAQARQAGAIAALPGLAGAAQLPSQFTGAVGSAQDADTQAKLLGQNDLFRRKNDAWTDLLAKLTSISNGNAAAGGTTSTTTTPTVPWWQSGLSLLGQFV